MANKTTFFKLERLSDGDKLSDNGHKYVDGDRQLIDFLLYRGATSHAHDGAALAPPAPDTAPDLEVLTNAGSIPAGRTVYYRYTYVTSEGLESLPSPEASVTTTSQVSTPNAPTLNGYSLVDGSLAPGQYQYAVSAYVTSNTLETPIRDTFAILLPGPGSTGKITLSLPTLPSGATGFNIYRRRANENDFFYMTSINMDVATPPSTWSDDGSVTANINRPPQFNNKTGANNAITVGLPGATPALPSGAVSWKIYRTFVAGDYGRSLLHNVVERTVEPDGPITTEYTDLGTNTTSGSFPQFAQGVTNPEKIDLGDTAEVQGYLPVGRNVVPFQVDFNNQGTGLLDEGYFEKLWVCGFEYAEVLGVRAVTDPDSVVQAQPLIFDVERYDGDGSTPAWGSLWDAATPNDKPTITIGDWLSAEATPNVTTLTKGDVLRVQCEQGGSGATPTEQDVTVSVYMLVRETRGDDTTSETGILGLS